MKVNILWLMDEFGPTCLLSTTAYYPPSLSLVPLTIFLGTRSKICHMSTQTQHKVYTAEPLNKGHTAWDHENFPFTIHL